MPSGSPAAAVAPPAWIEAVPLGVEIVMSPGVALIDKLPAAAWRAASPPFRPHAASASNAALTINLFRMTTLPDFPCRHDEPCVPAVKPFIEGSRPKRDHDAGDRQGRDAGEPVPHG